MFRTKIAVTAAALLGLAWAMPAAAHDVGPHKGQVLEWGDEEYHLELVPDAKAGSVTVYVYGDHAALDKGTAKAIETKSLILTVKGAKAVTVKLEPMPAKGDPEGKASVFVGKHDVFAKGGKLAGTVSGKVGTKPYSGDFK